MKEKENSDGLLIRRSLVRAQVGEPPNILKTLIFLDERFLLPEFLKERLSFKNAVSQNFPKCSAGYSA